jgi:hypothetical protein
MVLAALAVDLLFCALGLVPETRASIESITERGIELNYTAVLNIAFTLAGAAAAVADRPRAFAHPGLRYARRPLPDPPPQPVARPTRVLLLGRLQAELRRRRRRLRRPPARDAGRAPAGAAQGAVMTGG